MPLTLAKLGEVNSIKRITGKDDTKRFLEALGFVVGEDVTIVSELCGNMILEIKDTRIALNRTIANRIIV